jgi:phosphomannomutase
MYLALCRGRAIAGVYVIIKKIITYWFNMANINKEIFRSYDIRGIFPADLNKEVAREIGRGFVEYTGAQKIAVGRDMRISSPELSEALIDGIVSKGADVYNIGEVPTECMYFAVGNYDYQAGIMITASHNPKEYNGFKMLKKNNKGIDSVKGKDLIPIIEKAVFSEVGGKGEIKDVNVWQDYLKHVFSFINIKKIKPFKIVIDAGNGMAGKVVPLIKNKLPIEIIPLNFKLDGNFPAHPSNPLSEGAASQASKEIRKKGADFGFIFDGDADRIFLIDELGNLIKGDTTLLLLAKHFLKENPGKGVAYNLICSKAVPEFIKKWGGKPIRTAVGVVNIREDMMGKNGIIGGEVSGHYVFKDNFYFDSGFIAFLVFLQVISESGEKVSKIIKELSPYAKGAEINFEVANKEVVLNKIKETYSNGKQDYLDGVTVEYKNWWFNVRPSNTEPLLRLTIEADTEELLEEKSKELGDLIKKG